MTEIVNILSSILLLTSIMLGLLRFFMGPGALNRMIAFDLISVCIVGVVVVFSEIESSAHYIDMILIFCLLGFASAVVLTESLFRRVKKEEQDD